MSPAQRLILLSDLLERAKPPVLRRDVWERTSAEFSLVCEAFDALEAIVEAKGAEDRYGLSDTQVHHMWGKAIAAARTAIAKAKVQEVRP